MFEIRADTAKNRIYITMVGYMHHDEIRRATDDFIAKVKTLKPGLDVINDISSFRPSTQEGADEIKRAQAFLQEYGMGRVIRIITPAPEEQATVDIAAKVIGSAQFRRTAREVGYKAEEAASIAEAEAMLDQK